MRHIVILVHRHGAFDNSGYFLYELAKLWEAGGIKVTVQRGPGATHDADLAISHVDLTVVPPDHASYLRQYRRALNGEVIDISKRRISSAILRRGEKYDGPVIVKTNCNSGGLREAWLLKHKSLPRRIAAKLRNRLPWTMRAQLPTHSYPIFPNAAAVPRAVWLNPDLVVERFLCEQRDGFYCLRTWVFLGDRETNSLSYSPSPIIKGANVVRREAVDEVPAELRKIRAEMGFDYGKFDYGIVDGRVVLYDANRTPTLGRFKREEILPRLEFLAEGIRYFE